MKYLVLLLPLLLLSREVTVEQLFNVQTVKVKRITTAKTQKNYGYVVADESRIYDVVPRFGGYVERLSANTLYKKVKKGELLATVYSPEVYTAKEDYINALKFDKKRANKAMVKSAKAKLTLLNDSHFEIKKLHVGSRASRLTHIYAPSSGYLFEKNINLGSSFSNKTKLFSIVNLDEVWVEAKLHQKELLNLEELQTFKIHVKGILGEFNATKGILYPRIDVKEATATLRYHVKNRDHQLHVGMYTTIFASSQQQSYLTLPVTAVIRKNGMFYAFVTGEYEGEYEPIQIHVKKLTRENYTILEGLQEGDEVVNNALFMMDSDAQINGLY